MKSQKKKKTNKSKVHRASGLMNTWRWWESGALGEHTSALHLPTYPAQCNSSTLLLSYCLL